MNERKIIVSQSPENFAECFAGELIKIITGLSSADKITIALSGGSTPLPVFKILAGPAGEKIPWDRIHIFWADERCVPPDDPESNFGAADKLLLSRAGIRASNVHRIFGENNPQEEAKRYAAEIEKFAEIGNGIPRFDIILLGMGDDGHTASIFPDRPDLISSGKVCEASAHPSTGQNRITLTGTTLNNAANILFHVAGKSKSELIKKILNNEPGYETLPAGHIQPANGRLLWILDPDAAGMLQGYQPSS